MMAPFLQFNYLAYIKQVTATISISINGAAELHISILSLGSIAYFSHNFYFINILQA